MLGGNRSPFAFVYHHFYQLPTLDGTSLVRYTHCRDVFFVVLSFFANTSAAAEVLVFVDVITIVASSVSTGLLLLLL